MTYNTYWVVLRDPETKQIEVFLYSPSVGYIIEENVVDDLDYWGNDVEGRELLAYVLEDDAPHISHWGGLDFKTISGGKIACGFYDNTGHVLQTARGLGDTTQEAFEKMVCESKAIMTATKEK